MAAIGHYAGGRKPTPPPPYEPAFDGELQPKEGWGVFLGPQGDVYVGEHKEGKRGGKGALRTASGAIGSHTNTSSTAAMALASARMCDTRYWPTRPYPTTPTRHFSASPAAHRCRRRAATRRVCWCIRTAELQ